MDTINIGAYGFLESVAGMTIEVKMVCVKFAVLFAVIAASYGVIKFLFGFEDGNKIDFRKYVWTPLITIILLVNYAYLIDVTDSLGGLIIKSVPSANDKSPFVEIMNSANKRSGIIAAEYVAKHEENLADDQKSSLKKIGDGILNQMKIRGEIIGAPLRYIGKLFSGSLISFCRIIINNARGVILAVLVITGPLAILVSIIPLFREMLAKWYKAYLGVMMWAVTINLLDALIIAFAQNSVGVDINDIYMLPADSEQHIQAMQAANQITGDFGAQAGFINFIFALMYLSVPLLTSLWMGDRMLMGFMSNIMTKSMDFAIEGGKAIAAAVTGGTSMAATGPPKADTSGTE